jgi:hydrogenase-1 operon protein HyaE
MNRLKGLEELDSDKLKRKLKEGESFVLYVRSKKDYDKIKEMFDTDIVFPELAESFGDKLGFYWCDIDRVKELTSEYGIYFAPVIAIFKEGKLLRKLEGIKTWAEYNRAIGELLC